MSKRVLVLLAEGFEDIEAVAPVDILTRVGVEVTIAALRDGPVKAAYGTTILPHTVVDRIDGLYDGLVLPGGMENARTLAEHPKVVELVKKHNHAGKMIAAICASPGYVLADKAKILNGKKATGHPDLNEKLLSAGAEVTDRLVTVDGNIITGMGPGAAMLFALKLAEYLAGKDTVDELIERWRTKDIIS